MGLIQNSLYNPFSQSSLGFSLFGQYDNRTNLVLEDVDLYYQPVEYPPIAIVNFLIRLLYFSLGEHVQFKLYKMVKKENGLVNEVTQFYSIASMVAYPVLLLHQTSVEFFHPMIDIAGHWFCIVGRLVFYFQLNVMIFHSFFAALMRYWFIVHEEKVQSFGKEKVKKIFLLTTIFVPFLFVTWGIMENQELDNFMFLNRCYGIDHKVFLAELTTGTNLYCVFTDIGIPGFEYILNIIRQITCIIKFIVTVLIGLNLSELLIYIKIFSHIRAEHDKSMENLKNLLSRTSKIGRNQRVLLNIQIQVLAWMMEFVVCIIAMVVSFMPFIGFANVVASYLAGFGYTVLVPRVYLMNNDDQKNLLLENELYLKFNNKFFSRTVNKIVPSENPSRNRN